MKREKKTVEAPILILEKITFIIKKVIRDSDGGCLFVKG